MNKSSAIFIFFSLFVALSESFPKQYLVETEGGSKEESGKDMRQRHSGCVGGDSGKTYKDGEKFYEWLSYSMDGYHTFDFKCVCISGKSLANKKNNCTWQVDVYEDIDDCEEDYDYCYKKCRTECNMYIMLSITDDTPECSETCSEILSFKS